MRLTNYNRGYIERFNCSIHGTIYMTPKEWLKARKYLFKKTEAGYWASGILTEDCNRMIMTKSGYRINIRVPATELLVEKFDLKNYKLGNYQLDVSWGNL